MPNTSGKAYGLTLLAPILRDQAAPGRRVAQVREALATLPTGKSSPFAQMGEHHFVRLAVIDAVPFENYPAAVDNLRSAYLLMTSDFNGTLPDYLRRLIETIPDTIATIFDHCAGFPGVKDVARFVAYIEACQITTTLLFADQPDSDVPQVLRALDAQRRFIRFVQESQGSSDADLQQSFRRFVAEWKSAPTPAPATI
jgi:hypothetical protein